MRMHGYLAMCLAICLLAGCAAPRAVAPAPSRVEGPDAATQAAMLEQAKLQAAVAQPPKLTVTPPPDFRLYSETTITVTNMVNLILEYRPTGTKFFFVPHDAARPTPKELLQGMERGATAKGMSTALGGAADGSKMSLAYVALSGQVSGLVIDRLLPDAPGLAIVCIGNWPTQMSETMSQALEEACASVRIAKP